jgi:uncharacterized membrane protein
MSINGTPLHPLVVHAAVVFTPLAALVVIAYFGRPRWRPALRLPALVLSVVCGLAIVSAFLTGKMFANANPQLRQLPLVRQHESRATMLLLVGVVFAVVAVAAVLVTDRESTSPALATSVTVVAVLLAIAVLVLVVIVGDLGARAVYGGFKT